MSVFPRVWTAKLDGRYDCFVERTGDYTGTLHVMDGDKLLLKQEVSLAYAARIGPDTDDVASWVQIIEKAIPKE